MPDALTLLKTRRSVRASELVEPAPSTDEIRTMLTVASRVPDHGKLAPWRFIVFAGKARERAGQALAAIAREKDPTCPPEQVQRELERLSRAPLVIAVISTARPHPKIPEWEQMLSAAAAAFNLLLSAYALGYAGTWLTEWYACDEQAKAVLGIAPQERVCGFIHIGTPARPPEDRPRPDLDAVVQWFPAEG